MPQFTFLPVVDGDELPSVQRVFGHNVQAIAHGAAVLRAVVATKPEAAYVTVYLGEPEDCGVVGCWDWTRAEPEPAWHADS